MINLLPKNAKRAGAHSGMLRKLTALYLLVTLVLGAGAAGLFAYNQWLGAQTSQNQTELDELKKRRNANKDLVAEAAFINDRLKTETKYRDGRDWPAILDLAATVTPVDVRLTGLKFSGEAAALIITLTGESASRRSIILLKDKLANQNGVNSTEITTLAENKTGSVKNFTFTVVGAYASPTKKVGN
ncbi:MAG: PilN domain-containing protein [Patescibacteria group bacterium]